MTAPDVVRDLAERRAAARTAKDFAEADRLRAEIEAAGWRVIDGPSGWSLEAAPAGPAAGPVAAEAVADVREEAPTFDASIQWVCEGWPEDIERAIGAFRRFATGPLQFVVADVTRAGPGRWGEDVEVLDLEPGTGWAAARNAGLRRTRSDVVLAMDGSVEPADDVIGPLTAVLADPGVGIAGPFGIVTRDLRTFEEAPDP